MSNRGRRATATSVRRRSVEGPADGRRRPGQTLESPRGWLGTGSQSTVNITGNNVNSYLDSDANNRADKGGSAAPGGNFLTTVDLNAAPTTTGNKAWPCRTCSI
jgi:hypothetical protein